MGAVKAHVMTRRVAPRPAPRVIAPVQSRILQPALRVGAVNDPAEHEAEAMAAHVVANASVAAADAPPAAPAMPQGGPLSRDATDQPNTDSLVAPPVPEGQADITLPPANDVPTETLTTSDVTEMETGEPVGEVSQAPAQALRRAEATVGRMGGPAPTDVAARVANPGPGRPLPISLRQRVEPIFQTSFTDVRLHDTSADRDASARIGARAFAHGANIWLGPGEDPSDLRLMAHELTHVVQQTRGSDALPIHRDTIRREEGYFAGKGERIARQVPGYTLLTVLLGRTLISDEPVAMTATNLLGGLFGLVPGGTAIFDRLNETHAIDDAFAWVEQRLTTLNITWDRISGLLGRIADAVVSLSPIDNLIDLFRPLVSDIITFVGEITKKVLEFIIKGALKLAGPYADQVWAVIQKAGETLDIILEDPLGFAKNLIRAVVGGFTQFGTNIVDHLKRGVLGWLFGALTDIQMPEKLDFKGLMSLVLQILGLTYANFRKILVKQLGPKGEKMVSFVEKSIEFVSILLKEGFLGVWQKILSMIDDFKQTLIGGMTEMVTTAIVTAGIKWLASLTNPIGAVVRVVLSIYDMVVTFIERLQQIWDVAQSIFNSIGAIARGQVQVAADFVEQTIGRTVPVVLSFLAALLGLNGIPARIRAVFERLRAPVDRALTKLVDFLIKKAKALFSKLIGKVNGKRKLPGQAFKIGETEHSLFAKKKGKGLQFMIASQETDIDTVKAKTTAQLPDIKDAKSQKDAKELVTKLGEGDKALDAFVNINPENEKTPNAKPIEKMDTAMDKATDTFDAEGEPIDHNIATTSKVGEEPILFRAKEPRVEGFEGMADGSYGALQDKRKTFKTAEGATVENLSLYYDLDHTIEKRFPIGLAPLLNQLKPKPAATGTGPAVKRDGEADPQPGAPKPEAKAEEAVLGQLGTGVYAKPEGEAPQFPAIALYKGNHLSKKGKDLLEPRAIVETAIKEGGPDPAGKARSLLKRQLLVELSEIAQVVKADKDASDKIKGDVATGLGQIKAMNEALYGLAETTAAADTRAVKPALNGGKGSNFLFDGEPDFAKVEGVGVRYGDKTGGLGSYFEYDHNVDDAYPRAAKGLKILPEDQTADVEAAVAPKGNLDAEQSKRLKSLRASLLFTGTKMKDYDTKDGYSVPLYRVIHRTISGQNDALANVTAAHDLGAKGSIALLADYVRDGDEARKDKLREEIRKPIETAFLTRIAAHGKEVDAAYDANEKEVLRINAAAPPAAVTAKMAPIRKNLTTSVGDAAGYASKLFRG